MSIWGGSQPAAGKPDCIRCGEAPAVDDDGFCGHCKWAVRSEIEEGFVLLRCYLKNWARYADWCDAHGIAI